MQVFFTHLQRALETAQACFGNTVCRTGDTDCASTITGCSTKRGTLVHAFSSACLLTWLYVPSLYCDVMPDLAETNGAKIAFAGYRQAGGVEGIVNGMDTTDWSPNVDKFLDVKYDADTVDEGKALAKATLQAELGLPVRESYLVCICRHILSVLSPWS